MLDDLAEYRAEIRAIEDAWIEEKARIKDPSDRPSGSPWTRDWNRLRAIQERHGISPDDPRVLSIASFRHEFALLRADWDRDYRDRVKSALANPELEPTSGSQVLEYQCRQEDCVARHFPGLDIQQPEATATSIPNTWYFIRVVIDLAKAQEGFPTPVGYIEGAARRWAEQTNSILLNLHVPWAPDPLSVRDNPSRNHSLDHLRFIANRLEREEAETLPPALRRVFAASSLECARIEGTMAEPPGNPHRPERATLAWPWRRKNLRKRRSGPTGFPTRWG